MRAGPLDRKLTVTTVSEGRSGSGGVTETASTFAEVWAQKIELRGAEALAAGQERADRTVTWRMHWLSGLTAKMRLVDEDGTVWDIEHIAEIGRRRGLDVLATARGA